MIFLMYTDASEGSRANRSRSVFLLRGWETSHFVMRLYRELLTMTREISRSGAKFYAWERALLGLPINDDDFMWHTVARNNERIDNN